uniref:Class II aldolase/adducin N-terminal domain-containing protein n=1 Tax=Denticeps clupeoides TaxID=299321 RepID=A0AAY4DPW9_9TELE
CGWDTKPSTHSSPQPSDSLTHTRTSSAINIPHISGSVHESLTHTYTLQQSRTKYTHTLSLYSKVELNTHIHTNTKCKKSPQHHVIFSPTVTHRHTHTSSAINISHISGSVHVCTAGHGGVCVVNDLFATDRCGYSRLERQARCKLASLYRLLHLYNWTSLTHCYSTVRASRESEHILLLPVGLCFAEATAANLMKVDMLGSVLDGGSSGLASLCSSFSLHAHVYCCRPDIRCVIHTHTPAVAAVSSMKCGILPISHEAFLLGKVAYFSLTGSDVEERAELQAALGTTAKVVVLRGHGVLALGESLEEAFHYIYHCQLACDIQVKALSCAGGMDKLFLLDAEKNPPSTPCLTHPPSPCVEREDAQMEWRTGEAEFESLMRLLDNLGYRTGYPYRHPVVKEALRHRNEVEIPATVTTTGLEEEDVFVWRPVNFLLERQQRERARWLNSPNCYLKVNVPENSANGETSPRTRTWKKTAEIGSGGGTPIKIEDPNQFVPLNTNPTEVLVKRNQIRDQHWVDMMTAGPRSQLLAGIEVDKKPGPAFIYDDEDQAEPLPPNPFSQSDAELEEYKNSVAQQLSQQGTCIRTHSITSVHNRVVCWQGSRDTIRITIHGSQYDYITISCDTVHIAIFYSSLKM